MSGTKFWVTTPLSDMSAQEWESLCDGCGKCCVLKLEDVDTGEVFSTDVGCQLLDCKTARCQDYSNRKAKVPDCVHLTLDNLAHLHWMPKSCAYRRLNEGRGLPDWHPLVTGDSLSTIRSGNSVAGRIMPEYSVAEEDMPEHIFDWDQSE